MEGTTAAVEAQHGFWNVAFIKVFILMWVKKYQFLFSRKLEEITKNSQR